MKTSLAIAATALIGVQFFVASRALAQRTRKWTPIVTNSYVHDGLPTPQLVSSDLGKQVFVNGMTGVTTPSQGVTVNVHDNTLPTAPSEYGPAFAKKVEVQATINVGTAHRSASFIWYQKMTGIDNNNIGIKDSSPSWVSDDSGTGRKYFNMSFTTKTVDQNNTIYLYDAPGYLEPGGLSDTNDAIDKYLNSDFHYRDTVKWVNPAGRETDIVPGTWIPSKRGWDRFVHGFKKAGTTYWTASENK